MRLTPDPHSDHPQILLPCAVSLWEGGGYHCFWFTPDGYFLFLLCYSIPSDVCACVSHTPGYDLLGSLFYWSSLHVVLQLKEIGNNSEEQNNYD